jgi:hypothetical protein
MTNSCATFINGNHSPLVEVLEKFFQKRPEGWVFGWKAADLQSLMEICWFGEGRCVPGLHLIVDPTKACSEDCFGFVDLFVASSPESHGSSAALIELKHVTLDSLYKALVAGPDQYYSTEATESLRKKLKEEDASQLLERSFCYLDEERRQWCRSSISELLQKATQKVNNYLNVAKNGSVEGTHSGILDKRIICERGDDWLVGHIVICIGGTRVITFQVGKEQTRFSFRKASINTHRGHGSVEFLGD